MKRTKTYEERVQNQFGGFCIRVLKNESKNIDREFNYRREHEKSMNDLTESELNRLAVYDAYFADERTFVVDDNEIVVNDDLLASAIKQLPQNKRDIILLSYFVGMTDAEIAEQLNVVRQTISKRRTVSLEELKNHLLKEGCSWRTKD